jgi:predicted nucleic acid-binding Zn ribbon protein
MGRTRLAIAEEEYIKANSTSENYKSNTELSTIFEVGDNTIVRFRIKHGLTCEKIKPYAKCPKCGSLFRIQTRLTKRFCSAKCSKRFYYEQQRHLNMKWIRFSKEEVQYIKEHPTFTAKEIAERLRISLSRVWGIRSKYNLLRVRFRWTNDNVQYLRENYLTKTDKEIAEKLGSTEGSVRVMRSNLKLYRPLQMGIFTFLNQNHPNWIKEFNKWVNKITSKKYKEKHKVYIQRPEVKQRRKEWHRKYYKEH